MKGNEDKKKERELWEIIKSCMEKLIKKKTTNFHLEITADKKFSNKLKAEIPPGREIIFSFLKEAAPDITGFIKRDPLSHFITIEVKNRRIKIDNIYQIKKYRDLFNAKFAFLISTRPIPEEIKRILKVIPPLSPTEHETLALVRFDESKLMVEHIQGPPNPFIDWYPEDPFKKDLYWESGGGPHC